ncbi:MAG: hypothetical protein GY861_01635 [bacterium]|nr:hypothetical protein [bacterium]
MGCIYSDFDSQCTMYESGESSKLDEQKGACIWEEDPEPADTCPIQQYECDEPEEEF